MDFTVTCERDFNLEKILANKPFFFFFDEKPQRKVQIDGMAVKLSFAQQENKLVVSYDKDLNETQLQTLQERIEFCLGTKESMEEFYLLIYHDAIFSQLYDKIKGTRLVAAYDDFEALICLICSQGVTYEEYRTLVKRLIENVGKGVFPSPSDMLARKSFLTKLGMGSSKENQILEIATLYEKKKNPLEEDLARLQVIGEQTIEFFLLHQRRDYSHYYLDSTIKRIVRSYYAVDFSKDIETKNFLKRKFSNYVGLAVRYLRKLMAEDMSAQRA